jgi:lysophospholipase L1-like esterase
MKWLGVVGAALLAWAVAGRVLGWGAGLPTKVALIVALAGVLLLAAVLIGRRLAGLYATVALLVFNTLLLLLAVEAGATLFNHFAARGDAVPMVRTPEMQEAKSSGVLPALYVGWLGRPMQGRAITIGADGLRHTPPPPAAPAGARPLQVFAFGGSAMWGEGADDAHTIPAQLQAVLGERGGQAVQVTNFGQRAWVSTQGLVQLTLELQRGHVPDLVVFYDGYNDVFAAHATGKVGVPENFGDWQGQQSAGASVLRQVLKASDTGRLVRRLVQPVAPAPVAQVSTEPLARSVVQSYVQVQRIVLALGREYGFEARFYWQPQLITGRKPMTEVERAMAEQHPWLPTPVRELTRASHVALAEALRGNPAIADLSDVFDSVSEPIYLDPCHVSGLGNRKVAEAMAERGLLAALRTQVERRRTEPAR